MHLPEEDKTTIHTDYGEVRVLKKKITIGISKRSKIIGWGIIFLLIAMVIIFYLMGLRGNQWTLLLNGAWFLFLILGYMGFRYAGAFSDTIIIHEEKKNIAVVRRFLFFPYYKKVYNFSFVKSLTIKTDLVKRKDSSPMYFSTLTMNFNDSNNLSIARFTNQDKNVALEKMTLIGKQISEIIPCSLEKAKSS